MSRENISQKFRLKEMNETRNYFIEEIMQNELINKKHKKVCNILNYTEYLFSLAYTVTGSVFISAVTFLIDIPAGIASPTVGKEICAIIAIVKKYQSTIKKKKKKHDKIVLLAKTKINSVEVLILKALTKSYINHNEFVLVNNVLKEYNNMKEEIKDLKT